MRRREAPRSVSRVGWGPVSGGDFWEPRITPVGGLDEWNNTSTQAQAGISVCR